MNMAHGSPYDRGAADSYYRRRRLPHKMVGNEMVWLKPDSQGWKEYEAGYTENESMQNWKQWGEHD